MQRQDSRIFIGVMAVLLAGCAFPHAIRAPAITKELPYDGDAATAFDRKVKSRFPIGSDESAMRAELARQGFAIKQTSSAERGDSRGFEAMAMTNDGVCDMTWIVDWASRDGKLIAVVGRDFGRCE